MKMLLIAGHGAGDTGACGNGYEEADLTREAVKLLKAKLASYNVALTVYPTAQNCYEDLKDGKYVPFYKNDIVVEIHFNSFNKQARGVEVLYKMSSAKSSAIKVCAAIEKFGFLNRGPKVRTDLKVMNTCAYQNTPHILIETCFIDNTSDMKLYQGVKSSLWESVAAALASALGIKKKTVKKKTTTTTTKKKYSGTFPTLPKKGYIAKGDKGVNVGRLQDYLKWYGTYTGDTDQEAGPLTDTAIYRFQKAEWPDDKSQWDRKFGPDCLARAKSIKK